MPEDARIDHAGSRDLDPAGLLADIAALALADMAGEVDFDRRLGEREEVRAEPDRYAVAHHLLREIREHRLEVGERDGLGVDVEPLDLVEVRGVRRVSRVAAIGAAGADHADRRLVRHHRANLHGRGLRPQEAVFAKPESVAPVHRRMVRGSVERGEVVELRLELRTVRDGKAETTEDRGSLLDDAGERMLDAKPPPAAGEREIGVYRLLASGACALRRKSGLDFGAPRLDGLAERGTLFLRNVLHRLDERGDRTVAADILYAKRLDRRGVVRRSDFLQAFRLRILEFCKSHFAFPNFCRVLYPFSARGSTLEVKQKRKARTIAARAFFVDREMA